MVERVGTVLQDVGIVVFVADGLLTLVSLLTLELRLMVGCGEFEGENMKRRSALENDLMSDDGAEGFGIGAFAAVVTLEVVGADADVIVFLMASIVAVPAASALTFKL